MTNSIYITTTIPYVNAPPHIGFALELVQADALARYHRLIRNDVRFQSGTDENAMKNVLSARRLGVPVDRLVDDNSSRFRSLCKALDISVDRFLRTTEKAHHASVTAFLTGLHEDDLYRHSYHGLYCTGCEDFYDVSSLLDGRCPEHGVQAISVNEENVFFRLSRYEGQLHDLISTRRLRIVPQSRKVEVLRFIDRGLADISISRDSRRSGGWGIPFPGDSTQTVYVWIDALINYLTGLGYPDETGSHYWQATRKLHLIGKNVWKFHAVYWPALLLSARLPVPDEIVVHGFLTNEGRKISKSTGDAVDPAEYVRRFGSDAVRYFLLRHVRPFEDSDFSEAHLANVYQADLANGLGNLVSRLCALCEKAAVTGDSPLRPPVAPNGYHKHLAEFRFDLALGALWDEVTVLNREITVLRPWDDIKAGRHAEARAVLSPLVERLAVIAFWLSPFLPSTSAAIAQRLQQTLIASGPPLFLCATRA